jgi:anti-sigma factor ChrR (cupin superfamily)
MYDEPKQESKHEECGLTVMNEVHPNEEQLERYAMGRLAEQELAPVEEHLLVCEACQERLEIAEALLPMLRRALREVEREPAAEPFWKRWFASTWKAAPALAACAALILAVYVWVPNRQVEWQTVQLEAKRGELKPAEAVEGFALQLQLNTDGLETGPAVLQVVDAQGTPVEAYNVTIERSPLGAQIPKPLQPGQYWVRLKANGLMLREYALPVRSR